MWLRRIARWFGRRDERERVPYPVAFWMKDHVVTPIFPIFEEPRR